MYLSIILLVAITYFQEHFWLLTIENKIIDLNAQLKEVAGTMLDKDKFILTFSNIKKYIYIFIQDELSYFEELISESVNDILIFLNFRQQVPQLSKKAKKIIKMLQELFIFVKLDVEIPFDTMSDKEILVYYEQTKRNRNPKEMFNKVRRLPIFFKYKIDENILMNIFIKNILVFYNFFKTTLIALTLSVLYFIYTLFFFKIQFLKQLSVWFVIGMLYFWLMSGFNFFVKRYQFGKFTSQIQRFWKRTNNAFWLIEGFLILLFFYYYLNSSQEPLYMYDYSAINQEFLVSLQVIFINIVLLSVVIYFMYFTLIRLNSNSWTQINIYLVIISVFIFFSFFVETYQFYYIISSFNERLWVFNEEENLWVIDIENPIMRTKHQYLFVCLIAKYWHFLFIFLSWIFFLIKSYEKRKVTYVLFGANLQNMVLLYVLNFACYIQWVKWLYRRFFDLPYTWFFTNIDNKALFRVLNEMILLAQNLVNINEDFYKFNNIVYKSISFWNVDSLAMWKFI